MHTWPGNGNTCRFAFELLDPKFEKLNKSLAELVVRYLLYMYTGKT